MQIVADIMMCEFSEDLKTIKFLNGSQLSMDVAGELTMCTVTAADDIHQLAWGETYSVSIYLPHGHRFAQVKSGFRFLLNAGSLTLASGVVTRVRIEKDDSSDSQDLDETSKRDQLLDALEAVVDEEWALSAIEVLKNQTPLYISEPKANREQSVRNLKKIFLYKWKLSDRLNRKITGIEESLREFDDREPDSMVEVWQFSGNTASIFAVWNSSMNLLSCLTMSDSVSDSDDALGGRE